jgi:hypothetical protein
MNLPKVSGGYVPSGKTIWSVVGALIVVGGLIAGGWALDEHFTPREVHNLTKDQIYADMSQFRKDLAVQRAQDNVIYWQRIELQIQDACDRYPNDKALQRKLQRAQYERRKAEQALWELQRKK